MYVLLFKYLILSCTTNALFTSGSVTCVVFSLFVQNVTNPENLCVVTEVCTVVDDVSCGAGALSQQQQQHTLVAGQIVEVLAAPADLADDCCYVRVVTSASGRDVSASAAVGADAPALPLEGWVAMTTLRPQTGASTDDSNGEWLLLLHDLPMTFQ